MQILLKRAESNKENGEHKKAIADTTQAIELQPTNDKVCGLRNRHRDDSVLLVRPLVNDV